MATYTINENTARLSHEMRSFRDYHAGSATAEYEAQVAQAAAILEQVKAKCFTEEQKERTEYPVRPLRQDAGRGHQQGERDRHALPQRDDLRRGQLPRAEEREADQSI